MNKKLSDKRKFEKEIERARTEHVYTNLYIMLK